MLTGDSAVTATAIARQCGILSADDSIDGALASSTAVRKVGGKVVGLPGGDSESCKVRYHTE
jgi:magnesium-transporting ATPase (P-type)